MADKSSIEWTDATWNPTRGCSLVSAGCTHCYAMRQAHRFSGSGEAYEGLTRLTSDGPVWTGEVRLAEEKLEEPLHWKKPRRIFVNSMSDLFHESLPDEAIDKVFAVMALCPQHIFQILTKRPERMRDYICNRDGWRRLTECIFQTVSEHNLDETLLLGCIEELRINPAGPDECWVKIPLLNIHLGVSAENQETADARIPWLLRTPAAMRFISYEPGLGPLNLNNADDDGLRAGLKGALHWVIIGGESGPGARPFDIQWARTVIAQCKAAGVPVFVKQLGKLPHYPPAWINGNDSLSPRTAIDLKDKKGADWSESEWPEDLRVREYPKGI